MTSPEHQAEARRRYLGAEIGSITDPVAVEPMRMMWVMVTPEQAARWLERNGINRNVRKGRVATYAADMLAGAWLPTNDAICIAPDGTLLNGQHRLYAVIVAGVTVGMWVLRGVPPECMTNMDSGSSRTMGDVLNGRGEGQYNRLAACARALVLLRRGEGIRVGRRPSRAEMNQAIDANPGIRDSILAIKTNCGRTIGAPPTVLTLAHYLITLAQPASRDYIDEFFLKLETREGEPTGSAVHAVVKRLQTIQRTDYDRQLLCVLKGWNYWAAGTLVRNVQIPTGIEARELPRIRPYRRDTELGD